MNGFSVTCDDKIPDPAHHIYSLWYRK